MVNRTTKKKEETSFYVSRNKPYSAFGDQISELEFTLSGNTAENPRPLENKLGFGVLS